MWRFVACLLLVVVVGGCAQARDSGAGSDASTEIDAPGCVPVEETCNDADDDCDAKVDETFALKGMPCTAGVGACVADGTYACEADDLRCDAVPGSPSSESCDAVDNDCDTHVDEDFSVGIACDGPDADTCKDGMIICNGLTATSCTDMPGSSAEVCDNIDNDCDMSTDEGFGLGVGCDGVDSDACVEGTIVCNGSGGTTCSDTSSSTTELCNGADDDCKNGVDDPFPVGQACTVGLGACARTGQQVCNGAQTGTQCSATPGMPTAELCGNGSDEDCNGADAGCPGNDLPAGAIDISGGGTFTVDLAAAHDNNWIASPMGIDCGEQGGRDVFYQVTTPAAEVVYVDTFGSNYDTMVRVFAGSCTALGALRTCFDDACATQRSQGALELAAGTHCIVVDQYANTATTGATTLTLRRGGRPGTPLSGTSGTATGTTTGKTHLSVAGCEANTMQPDVGHFFVTCSGSHTISANTCSGTAFDSVIYLRTGAATTGDVSCSDDVSGCGTGLQSRITNATVSGPNLHWVIVDGFGQTGNGAYSLSYSIQ